MVVVGLATAVGPTVVERLLPGAHVKVSTGSPEEDATDTRAFCPSHIATPADAVTDGSAVAIPLISPAVVAIVPVVNVCVATVVEPYLIHGSADV